ncbi:uncharacterized protein PV09_06790 [Verruconis gallopava]|uniref:Luciferase domain-containing protein n=1 Tax=Verruconis gallopava TaxID=253628 RepID=A0A0D2A5E0_9PEZI|nr:uncharacterized protein PV09_06790 [Verruconis gallopava]KIW01953.1 hypothetical protein PV09_06790 [Verruconis gallopava]
MTSILPSLMAVFNSLRSHATLSLATTAALFGLVIAYRDYRAYVAMGPHGLPDNFYGWQRQLMMARRARKDVTAHAPYDESVVAKALGAHAKTSFLSKPLTPRVGERPRIPGFVAPQRQVTEIATESRKRDMFAYIKSLVEMNDSMLQSELSCLEGPVPALQLKDGVNGPSFLDKTRGEIAHIHPPDGSTHLVLSLADSEEVIAKGWGQRHRLSGGFLPWTYTLIYAPRTDEEFEVWKDIVIAVARFCCKDEGDIQAPRL